MLNVCQTSSERWRCTQRSGSLRELERFLGSDQSQRCCFLGSLLTTCRILNNPLLLIMIFNATLALPVMPACVSIMSFILGKLNMHSLFFFFQETLICPSADLIRGWKYPNFCFLVVFYFLTGPHPDEITYLHAGNVRQELEKSENNLFFFFDPWIHVTISLQSKFDNLLFYLLPRPTLCYVPDSHRLLCMWKKDGFFYFLILFGFAVEFLILWMTPFGCEILLFRNLAVARL